MDSMMIGSNPVDPQSNFTGPNLLKLAEATKPEAVQDEVMAELGITRAEALKIALKIRESRSRKLRRAQYNLEATIKDLKGAGYDTADLESSLDSVKILRTVARSEREAARTALKNL
jgi:hypothetical protein